MARDVAYSHAEKEIEKIAYKKQKHLDLSVAWNAPDYEWLSELPESLGRLTWLESLNLEGNTLLTTLPAWFGQLTNLKSLNVSWNQLTILPETIGNLKKLQFLNLSHNKLEELPNTLENLTQLKKLDLSYNQFAEIPMSIGNLLNLQSLALYSNKIEELSEPLNKLTQLKSLNLSSNQLAMLPDWIGNLLNLQSLALSSNKIGALPESLNKLTQLKSLDISDNQLTLLPEWLENFTELQTLNIQENQLANLPTSLVQLKYLKELKLGGNPLNPQLATAYTQSLVAVYAYLRKNDTAGKFSEPQQTRKLKVFLCHASQDKQIVHELYKKLVDERWIEPWLDAKKLLPGQDWQTEIKNAVETADNVIIFLSNTSINKDGFIQKELRFAKEIALEKSEGSVFLIPIRLDDCEVPRSLKIYQWADYFGAEQEQTYAKLVESLKLRLEDLKRREMYTK